MQRRYFFLLSHPHGNSQKYPSVTPTCQQAPFQPRLFGIAVLSQVSGGTVNSGSVKCISFYYKTILKPSERFLICKLALLYLGCYLDYRFTFFFLTLQKWRKIKGRNTSRGKQATFQILEKGLSSWRRGLFLWIRRKARFPASR